MKNIFVLAFLLVGLSAFGQSNPTPARKDSLSAVLKTELQLSKETADSVSAVFATTNSQMLAIINNKVLTKEQKLSQMQAIAAQRDQKISSLLTPSQVQGLKAIMAANKERMKAKMKATH